MSEKKDKICPKCNSKFPCMGEDCWCEHYQILPKNLHYIRKTWDNCLCPECLKEFAENKEQIRDLKI